MPAFAIAAIAIGMLVVDSVRLPSIADGSRRGPVMPAICRAVAMYAGAIVVLDPFLDVGGDNVEYVAGLVLLLPFLITIGPLARSGAWLGALGSAMFYAVSIGMLIRNASNWWGSNGFLSASVR
jgi:hypothetical protein